jgi:hypothetical protein
MGAGAGSEVAFLRELQLWPAKTQSNVASAPASRMPLNSPVSRRRANSHASSLSMHSSGSDFSSVARSSLVTAATF